MFKPLDRSFYEPTAAVVAPQLLGHWLIRQTPEGPVGGVIVETEAYLVGDAACHACKGETPRNRTMWGEPGIAYVYLIYGMYYCLNAVCRPARQAEAVLLRAIEPTFGADFIQRNRPDAHHRNLTSGPSKLCAALGIDKGEDGLDFCDPSSSLIIARNPNVRQLLNENGPVLTTLRIGINPKNPAFAWPLRYVLARSPHLSRRISIT